MTIFKSKSPRFLGDRLEASLYQHLFLIRCRKRTFFSSFFGLAETRQFVFKWRFNMLTICREGKGKKTAEQCGNQAVNFTLGEVTDDKASNLPAVVNWILSLIRLNRNKEHNYKKTKAFLLENEHSSTLNFS